MLVMNCLAVCGNFSCMFEGGSKKGGEWVTDYL